MWINKDRTWKKNKRASLRPHIQHHQLSHVTLNYSLPLVVCVLMLPMLVVAVEHMQLATAYRMNPLDRCSLMTFIRTPLVLPSLNNVLPAMVLQNRRVRLNTGYTSCFSSHSSVQHVFPSPDVRVYSSLGRRVVGVVVALLLLLSGDIELNPGPLGLHDLPFLHHELHQVSHKWFPLGVQLQVPIETLKCIETEHNQMSRRLLEMLTVWLQRTNPPPTWNILTAALESPPVEERLLAQQVRDKYCTHNEGWVTPSYPTQVFSPSTAASTSQGRLLSTTSGAYGRGVEAPEYHTFREYYDRLVHAIQDPLHLAARLFIRNIIDSTLLQCMIVPALPPFDKTNTLLTAVLGKVQTDPRMFGVFLSALNEDPSMQSLVESMQGGLSCATSGGGGEPTDGGEEELSTPAVKRKCVRNEDSMSLFDDTPLEEYADFLRACYTKDESKWPHLDARKYVKLEMINSEYADREDLVKFIQLTIRGSVIDIPEWKAPIQMRHILKPNYDKKNKQIKHPVTQVLIEGAPGIGKSMFAWEVCQKWGQHQLFNEYSLVVLLRFRDKRVQEAKSVSDLFYHPISKLQSEIVHDIILSGGHGLLLILEGFDEAPASKRAMDSIFVRLFRGQELPNATVILTTRPSASGELRQFCNSVNSRRIEIVGFGKKEIDEYIQCAFSDEQSQSDFKEYLSLYPHIHSMMYVPLNSAIVTHVYESCKSSGTVVPKTMTQLYSSLIRTLLLRYLKAKEEYKDTCTNINSFKDLPQPVYDQFCEICKIAYTGIMSAQTELIFQDLPSDFDPLGLMQSCPELYVDRGASVSYNFLHLTVQEYLAAYHISQQSRDEQVTFMSDKIFEMEVVVRFLAGLTELGRDLWDVVREFASDDKLDINTTFLSEENFIKLEILHLLFESQDPSAITSVLGSDYVCFYDYDNIQQSFDWYVLGYCIAHSSCDWKLELDECKLESVELFLRALNLHQDQCQLSPTGKIKEMWLRESDQGTAHLLVDSMSQLVVFHNLTHLCLVRSGLTSETCNLLSKHSLQHLEYLNLSGNTTIDRGGAVNLITSLTKFSIIRKLHLNKTGIGFEDCKALSELLATSKYVKVLDIGNEELDNPRLSPDSVQCIVDGLSHNTSLETLNMNCSNFSSENVLHLASVLRVNTRLKELDIRYCNIQSSDSVHLAKALGENTTTQLQTLWLMGNPIGPEGAVAFASMLQNNQCLKTLDLRDDSVGVEGALELIESLKHNATLKKLMLSESCKPPSFSTLDKTLQNRVIFGEVLGEQNQKYFMPCAITHSEEETATGRTQSATIPPLLITFKSGYCPKGLFGGLIACITTKQVGNCTLNLDESKIHRDQICFTMDRHHLLLRVNPTYIYIEIIPNDPSTSLSTFCIPCNCVRKLILANIKTACANLHYADNIDYHISFECPCNQPENFHPAALRPDMNNCFVCVQSKKVIDVRKECYVWLPQPTIIQNPESQSVTSGSVAEFRVEATGDVLQFQWQKNATDVHDHGSRYHGTDSDTLHILMVERGDKGCYRCCVKNYEGEEFSNDAVLTVNEVRPLSTAVNRAKQFGVQFIDPIEIISCDTLGCDYYNPRHDVRLKIPEGAILPSEGIIDIEFGVTMHGPFKLSDGISVRRVSPVVWLCVQQDGFSGFQKDVEITIPHFLHLCTEDADKYLRFLEADHQLHMSDASGKEEYHLKPADGKAVFDRATHGTLLTKHFCWQCLASSIYPNEYTKYCLIGGRSKRSLGTQDWQIIFVVCYLLQSCISTVEQQLGKENRVHPAEFMFADGKDVIELKISDVPGWLLAMESSKVSAKEVDFQGMKLDDLQTRQNIKLYPPRFVVTVKGSSDAQDSKAVFTFEGTVNPIVKEIILARGIEASTSPVCPGQEKAFLDERPTLRDLHCFEDRHRRKIKIMKEVEGRWYEMALSLGLESATESIELSTQSQADKACQKVFTTWIRGSYRTPVTWKTVLEALNECDFGLFADEVKVALVEKHVDH